MLQAAEEKTTISRLQFEKTHTFLFSFSCLQQKTTNAL